MSSRRSANFTHHEKEILLSLMQTYRHIVEDKRTDGIMVKEKNAAWIELTNKYNAQNEVWTRSVKQLRQCWKNLKSRARIDLMRVNLQTTTSDSDPNSVRLNLVPLNNVSKPTDNSNHSSNNINNTTVNIINNNNNNTNNNINNANNNNNPPNIILSSILNNNNNNSNTIKSGSVSSYGSHLQALTSTAGGSNSVVGLSPSLLRGGSLSNRPNSKTSGSKKRKKKKVVLNDVGSRNFATNDNNSNSNSNSSSRRRQRLLTVSSATIGVERDDVDDDEDDADDDDEEDDTVAVLAAANDDDSNTIGARRRRRRRLHPASKSTSIGDSALVDVADENDEFDEDDENEEDEEDDDEEDDDVEGDDNEEVDDDDDDNDSGTVDDDIYNEEDVRRSSRHHHRSGVAVDGFHVEQNSDPSLGQPAGAGQDVDPLYSVENLAVVSVSGSADRIHFQHHANSPTSDLQNQTDGNLLHSHHPHHQSQHHQQQQHQPPHLHSQVNNYHHSNRLSADSITRLDDDFSSTEPDIKVFDSIRGFGKVLHSQSSFSNQIVNNNSVNFTPSINYSSDIGDLNGVAAASQSGPLIVSAHSENGGQMPAIEPVLVEKVNDHDMLLDDLRKTEHAEKMKNIRLERKLINVEHKARMGLIKLKSEYIKLKMDFLLQNKR